MFKCNVCPQYYHKKCYLKNKIHSDEKTILCNLHYCYQCKVREDDLFECIECPRAYHKKCMTKGDKIIKNNIIICRGHKKNSKNNWVTVDPLENKMIISNKKIAKTGVPDVRGMGARDAMYVLENVGLSVSIYGKGKVIKQSLTPGTTVNRQRIEVFLN